MPDLSDLIRRVEEAKGPDRELDAEITVAIMGTTSTDDDLIYHRLPAKDDHCAPGTYWRKQRSGASLRTSAELTDFLAREFILQILRALQSQPEGK